MEVQLKSRIVSRMKLSQLSLMLVLSFLLPHLAAAEASLNRFTLPNGLPVIIQEDHGKKVVTIQLWVNVGSANEKPSQRGLSHLIEHMAFKGTKRRGVGQIAAEIKALGGRTNAYTSWDRTVFHVTVPSDAVVQGLDILTDAVVNAVIDSGELAKEKEVVIEEILEGQERPSRKFSHLLFRTAYIKHPYRFPVIGYRNTVEKITRSDIMAFRKKWYAPQNMFLLIVGDVDPVKLRPHVEKVMKGFAPRVLVRPDLPVEPPQTEIRSALERDGNARETRLALAFHISSIKGADVNALDLAAEVLAGQEISRLVRLLKKEKQLVHSVYAYSMTPKYPGLFVVGATLAAENLEPTTREIMSELRRLGNTPPSRQELERAKTAIAASRIYRRETVQGMAHSLGNFQADAGDAAFEAYYFKANERVTPSDVSAAVKKYLTPPNVSVVVLMPKKADADFRIDTLTKAVASFTPKKALSGQERTSKVVTRTLSNGMRVILIPDHANPVVSLRIACLGGKRFETRDSEGIMNFISRMVTRGTKELNEREIYRRIEDMGGRIAGFSGSDSFGITASFLSTGLEKGLELAAEVFRDPVFPTDVMERERKLVLNRIKTEADRPVSFAVKKLKAALFSGHPYGFDKEGTVKTVSSFTREDLLKTYKRFAVPSNTVVTLVGDLDPISTMKLVERLFGDIPAEKFVPPNPPEPSTTQKREKVIRIPRAKAHILIGFHATTFSDPDRYPLAVLNNLLSGQGGRLFRDLRDKESLAYVVTSFFRPGMDPGMFGFYIACDPSKADKALEGLLREIQRVRATTPSKEELVTARRNIIGNHQISLQSSAARAGSIGLNELYGLGYDYDDKYVEQIAKVSGDQVRRAANKYLDPSKATIVKILPKDK